MDAAAGGAAASGGELAPHARRFAVRYLPCNCSVIAHLNWFGFFAHLFGNGNTALDSEQIESDKRAGAFRAAYFSPNL